MKPLYASTRGGVAPVDFQDAVMMGLADDGGLLIPQEIPSVEGQLSAWRTLSYPELAFEVMRLFIGDSIAEDDLRDIIQRSYATFDTKEVVPIRKIGSVFLAELFHGPTLAFKDVALQFLGNVFEHILAQNGERLNILGATSGDTGSAAIHGVRGKKGIDIFIMYPHNRVSPLQERQMATVPDSNVHCIAIHGTFDDGQRVLKEVFNDIPFKRQYHLGAVNSVNWARILAQVVYYFWGAFRVQDATGTAKVQVTVPTGNFGDIFAGYIAKRMGAPISRLGLATNENDILYRFFTTGVYTPGQTVPTLSPSMDIQVASNFERYLYYRLGQNSDELRSAMEGFAKTKTIQVEGSDPEFFTGKGTTEETLATIRKYYAEQKTILDPHTAVGVTVAERNLRPDEPTLCLATAHPAKFASTIGTALGDETLATHPTLERIKNLPLRVKELDPFRETIQNYMAETLR